MKSQSQLLVRGHLDQQEKHAHQRTAVEADHVLAGEEVEEDVEDRDEAGERQTQLAVEGRHVLGLLHEGVDQVVLDVEVGEDGEGVEEGLGVHGHPRGYQAVRVPEHVHLAVVRHQQRLPDAPERLAEVGQFDQDQHQQRVHHPHPLLQHRPQVAQPLVHRPFLVDLC